MKNKNIVTFALASTLCLSAWIGVSAFIPKNENSDKKIIRTEKSTASISTVKLMVEDSEINGKFEISEKGKRLIKEKLTAEIRKIVYGAKKGRAKEFMSRCPSGIHDNIMKEPLNAGQFFYGEVRQYDGCADKLLCEFRMSSDETTLQIWDNVNKSFASFEKWLPSQTQAKLSRGTERELAKYYENTNEKEQAVQGRD